MKKSLIVAFASFGILALSGCGYVTSGMPSSDTVSSEMWYVKKTWFLMTWSTHVYYCPKPTGKGPVKCIEAIMHEEGEGAGAPDFGGGFGAPGAPAAPGYGAPAAPGYGAPAAPGYGAPTTPSYGAPATPSYGAPATPGYGTPAPSPNPNPGPPPPGY